MWSTFIQSLDERTRPEVISKIFPLQGDRGADLIKDGALLSSVVNGTKIDLIEKYLPRNTIKSLYDNLPSSYTLPTDDDFDVKWINYTDALVSSKKNDELCISERAKNNTFECEIVDFDLV